MRVIVAGGGRVGMQLASLLAARGDSVAVIEVDVRRVEQLREHQARNDEDAALEIVAGNACVAEVLEAAGALRAKALLACTADDAENLVVSVLAKRHLEVPLVLARCNEEANRWLFDASWGVDGTVSEASALASLLDAARRED
jgi:trk system potassium uptake protein TrkA